MNRPALDVFPAWSADETLDLLTRIVRMEAHASEDRAAERFWRRSPAPRPGTGVHLKTVRNVKPIDFSRNSYILELIRQTIECLRPSPGTEVTAKVGNALVGKLKRSPTHLMVGRFHLRGHEGECSEVIHPSRVWE